MELNGPDFDWLHSPVDVRALYQCSCGRRHGKWATFNGIVNDRAARAELQRSRASSIAAKRQREEENHMRKEAQDSIMAKEYAQNLLQWGTMVQAYYDHMQRFMEAVALQNGMPATAVPPPLPIPPQHPTYGISPSPNPSPGNAGTFGSYIRGETPEEILSRIAYGGFGHRVNADGSNNDAPVNTTNTNGGDLVNATTSGGGNYSPPQGDDFPLF